MRCDGKPYFGSFSTVKYLSCDFVLHSSYNYTDLLKKLHIQVIDGFLNLLKDNQNGGNGDHVFVIPATTTVLWERACYDMNLYSSVILDFLI